MSTAYESCSETQGIGKALSFPIDKLDKLDHVTPSPCPFWVEMEKLPWRLLPHYPMPTGSNPQRQTWTVTLRLTLTVWDESYRDIGLHGISAGELWRWCTTTCTSTPILKILQALDVVKSHLLDAVEQDNPKLLYYSTLKAELRANGISAIVISLLKPVMAAVVDSWHTAKFSTVFRCLYQCVSLPSRWNPFLYEDGDPKSTLYADRSSVRRRSVADPDYSYSMKGTPLCHTGAYMKFMFDTFCKFCENNDRLLGSAPASPYIQRWFQDYLGDWIEHDTHPIPSEYFRFSGGATREFKRGTHELEKAAFVATHHDPYLLQAIEDLTWDDWTLLEPFACLLPAAELSDVAEVHAQLAMVPKSWKAFRTITKEPTGLVLYQQGLARSWREYYSSHPELAGRYTAEHGPTVQRKKALEGSIHGRYATIDLSSASDSVTMIFAQSAFRLLPRTWRYLEMGRTAYADPPEELGDLACPVKLNFFAGMGNPLTFNLEVCVFLAIGAEAIHLCGGDFRQSILSVVGDDIIIETKYYDKVVELLTRYGFLVNTDKSYCGHGTHLFRESCGIHALDGCDVTPALLPRSLMPWRKPKDKEMRTRRMSTIWPVQAISVANDLRIKGLRRTRAEVIALLRELLPAMFLPRFCSIYETDGIQSLAPTNFHLKPVSERFVQESRKFRRIWLNDTNTVYRRYGRLTLSCQSQWDSGEMRMVPVTSGSNSKRGKQDPREINEVHGFLPFEFYWVMRRDSDPRRRWLAAIGLSSETSTEMLPFVGEDLGPYPFTGGPCLWWEATIGTFPA